MKLSYFGFVVAAFFALNFDPHKSFGMHHDVKSILVSGSYGLAGGTAAGLLLLPFSSGNLRTTFLGSSVGLYLGLVVGIYHITHRNDPQNPLRSDTPSSEQSHYMVTQMKHSPRQDNEHGTTLFYFSAELINF